MRFGCNWLTITSEADLESNADLLESLDVGTIAPPTEATDWNLDRCEAYGEMIRSHGYTVGELGYFQTNLLHPDSQRRSDHIEALQAVLRRGNAMGADCVASCLGSFDPKGITHPHPDNVTDRARDVGAASIERVLDGLELDRTVYALEPFPSTFVYQPEAIREFLDRIDDDRVRLHMDIMNMHDRSAYFDSTSFIERTFDKLRDDIASVHLKDLRWDPDRLFMHFEEVPPETGALDMDTYFTEIDDLDADLAVFTEHWEDTATYRSVLETMGSIAERNGIVPLTP